MHTSPEQTKAGSGEAGAVHYAPALGAFSGTMLVVGGIIGAGIFLSPSVVAQRVGTSGLTLGVWSLGALVALAGAFVYAELGALRPRAGGTYIYLRDAFGTLPAFLYGWSLFFVIGTGAIAAVAMTGANYLAPLIGGGDAMVKPLAASFIVVLTILNIVGVSVGAITGNILTVLKLAAIALLVFAALLLVPSNPSPVLMAPELTAPDRPIGLVLATGAALVPVLFSFGGWQQTNAVAEELRNPRRTLPLVLVVGVLIVVATYLLVNIAYLKALGVEGLAASTAPAADTMYVYLGDKGRAIIAAGIVISTVGFLGLVILMSARVYQAMAADGLFFQWMARLNPRTRTPVGALVSQGVVALVLLVTGTYAQLLDYVVFADWIFFGSTAAALFVLRKRADASDDASVKQRMRVPLHPLTTLLFIAAAVYVMAGSIWSNPANAARGVVILALGVPVHWWWKRQRGLWAGAGGGGAASE